MPTRRDRTTVTFVFRPLMIAVALWAVPAGAQSRSDIKSDEAIVFYPTFGSLDRDNNVWRFEVQGKVFEPEDGSLKRALFLSWLRGALDKRGITEPIREDRVRPFLVDNEGGKSVTIQMAGTLFAAGESDSSGRFASNLSLPLSRAGAPRDQGSAVAYRAVLREGDPRLFRGRVHLIPPDGVSVISDIDDTIKDSNVLDKSELLRSTFMREFKAVTGMSELYDDMSRSGVAFHYVSGSPWQLYEPLQEFLLDAGFPQGTMHLKYFRIKDSSALDLIRSQTATKMAAIEPILAAYPDRKFLLFGDSSEQDPEIYGNLARQHPDQIVGIYIRNVTQSNRDDPRFNVAFDEVPSDKWELFEDVSEVDVSSVVP